MKSTVSMIICVFLFAAAVSAVPDEPADQESMVKEIYETVDPQQRLGLIDAFLALEDKDPRMNRYVYKAYFKTLEAMGDFNALEAVLPDYINAIGIADGVEAAETYNMIAYAFTPSLKHLDMAKAYARKSLEILLSASETPRGVDPAEWPAVRAMFEANVRDTLGYILYRDMVFDEAVAHLEKSVKVLEDQWIPRMHLGMAYEKTGDFKASYENLLYADFLGGDDPEIADALKRVGEKAFSGWEKVAFENKIRENVKSLISAKALAGETNMAAPGFELDSLEGGRVALSDLKGSVVLLDFWATWCGPCNLEMPVLEGIYREYAAAGLKAVAVSVDDEETVGDVPGFIAARNLTLQVLYNDGKAPEDYGVGGIPALYVIDKKGNIRFKHVGYSDDLLRSLKVQVEYLLNE